MPSEGAEAFTPLKLTRASATAPRETYPQRVRVISPRLVSQDQMATDVLLLFRVHISALRSNRRYHIAAQADGTPFVVCGANVLIRAYKRRRWWGEFHHRSASLTN